MNVPVSQWDPTEKVKHRAKQQPTNTHLVKKVTSKHHCRTYCGKVVNHKFVSVFRKDVTCKECLKKDDGKR